ncbi:hypothetical protein Gferi_24110 [Geosporobacter ferrireducens]|uniref:Phosphoesterase n=1 Tax=Geosporobacter ferrireducens TaxID=1424294 RepID=A0A1D8GR19_9FIRM|nr:hypothetical protein Gferi_24110 [Geosporobacter ferrireducens]MTI56384.1 metallophosphoesterase [Geosporobacter ferrireducens]
MKVAVIADTHLKSMKKPLPRLLYQRLINVDVIFHCGDIQHQDVLSELEGFAPVYAVKGNGDSGDMVTNLPEKCIVELNGYRIGIFHGHGEKGRTVDRAFNSFIHENVDIVIFGHSHQPLLQTKSGILLLNPGSPTVKRREKKYSFILLYLEETLRCEFVLF